MNSRMSGEKSLSYLWNSCHRREQNQSLLHLRQFGPVCDRPAALFAYFEQHSPCTIEHRSEFEPQAHIYILGQRSPILQQSLDPVALEEHEFTESRRRGHLFDRLNAEPMVVFFREIAPSVREILLCILHKIE